MKPGNRDPAKGFIRSRCQPPVVGSEEAASSPSDRAEELAAPGGAEVDPDQERPLLGSVPPAPKLAGWALSSCSFI